MTSSSGRYLIVLSVGSGKVKAFTVSSEIYDWITDPVTAPAGRPTWVDDTVPPCLEKKVGFQPLLSHVVKNRKASYASLAYDVHPTILAAVNEAFLEHKSLLGEYVGLFVPIHLIEPEKA